MLMYDILHSKSLINQATSKAMLTQMISIVFRRMESDQVWFFVLINLYNLFTKTKGLL